MTSNNKEEEGSFVDSPKNEKPKSRPSPPSTSDPQTTLFEKLDEIKNAVEEKENGMVHQLCRIADALEKLIQSLPSQVDNVKSTPTVQRPTPPTPPPTPRQSPELDKLKAMFTTDVLSLLEFKETTIKDEDVIIVNVTKFLGGEIWTAVVTVMRALNARYVPKDGDKMPFFIVKKENIK